MSTFVAAMQRQRCKACWNADGFNFHVPDDVWQTIVPPELQNHVVCLQCFDDFATDKGINYAGHLAPELHFAGGSVALVLQVVSASGSRRSPS